jgi:hypothetical protein
MSAHPRFIRDPGSHPDEEDPMDEQYGFGVDDLPWIYRDQFVYYGQLAHSLADPHDWPQFRQELLDALTSAFVLDSGGVARGSLTDSQRRALAVLDELRRIHDPATDWPAFFDALWARRHAIKVDLPEDPVGLEAAPSGQHPSDT